MAAQTRLNPTVRMSKIANADDILAVARDADAIQVTYAKLTREILAQFTKCKAIGCFGLGVDNTDLPAAKEKGIAVKLRAGLLHPRSLRPYHGAAARADPQDLSVQQAGAKRALGNAGGGADPAHRS